MRETIWSLIALALLLGAWGLGSYGLSVTPIYYASAFGGVMAIWPALIAMVVRIYQDSSMQGIVVLVAVVLATVGMIDAVIGADGRDRENLVLNLSVGLIGFATGVGYRRLTTPATAKLDD